MSDEDLVSNDEVNMQIFKVTHPDVPGHLSIVAENDKSVESIFREWFYARFGRPPMKFLIEDVSRSLRLAGQLYEATHASKRSGVAYAVEEHGWIVLPPDIEAPGPYYLSAHPVECYKFSETKNEPGLHIFARTAGDAWHIYHLWAKEHGRQTTNDSPVKMLHLNKGIMEDARLARAAGLGVTGVVSMRLSGWDVLPPWDEAAGTIF